MTAPAFESATTASANSSTSLTLDKPTGTAEGDLLVAICAGQDDAAGAFSLSGWTADQYSSSTSNATVLYKVAGSSEPSSYSFTYSPTSRVLTGCLIRISGIDTTSPVATLKGGDTASVSASPDPPVTASVTSDDYLAVVMFAAKHTSGASQDQTSPPLGYTERADISYNNTWCCVSTKALTGATSEDAGAATLYAATFGTLMWTMLVTPTPVTLYDIPPTDDVTTTGWASTPLWSKIDDDPDSPDATVITGAAS